MSSGPQPAVEGTNGGSIKPSPSGPGPSDGDVPHAAAPPRAPSETSNGRTPAGRRLDPRNRTGASSRQSTVATQSAVAKPLPVGRATSPDGRGHRQGAGTGPHIVTGRRTRRVVRRIDIWTVLKMSFLFYLCVFLVFMIAGVVLWNIAEAFNVVHSVEKFIRSILDLQKFTFRPAVVLQSYALGGGILVLLATGANVLAALLYNLISDVVGGVQFIVLEETTTPE